MQQVRNIPNGIYRAGAYSLPPPLHAGAFQPSSLSLDSFRSGIAMASPMTCTIEDLKNPSLTRRTNMTDNDCMTCPWEHLDYSSGYRYVESCIEIGGPLGASLSFWLCAAIILSNHRYIQFYRNILYYFLAVSIRRGLPGFIRSLKLWCMYDCAQYDSRTCKWLGFWDNFLAVFELEILTHMCIERFISAWYAYRGWRIPKWHHSLFLLISLGLAFVYSFMPWVGIGKYCKDFICKFCNVDAMLPTGRLARIAFAIVLFLRTYKPMIFMIVFIGLTYYLLRFKVRSPEPHFMTQGVFVVAMLYMMLCLPHYIVKMVLLFYQYYGIDITGPDAFFFYHFGLCTDMVIPLVTVFTYAIIDRKLLNVMLIILFFRYDLLGPVVPPKVA